MTEARNQREEIAQYFRDVTHWNSTRGLREGMIDPDPDNSMRRMAKALDDMLMTEENRIKQLPQWCRHISLNTTGRWCYNGMDISGWHFCPKCATPCPEQKEAQ